MSEIKRKIQVILKDLKKIVYTERGTTILELINIENIPNKKNIVGAIVNNQYTGLLNPLLENSEIEFIFLNTEEGLNIYRDTAVYVLAYAIEKIFNKNILRSGPSIRYNYYFDLESKKIDKKLLKNIEKKMWEIIKKNIPIKEEIVSKQDAINFYKSKNDKEKVELLKSSQHNYFKFYSIEKFKEIGISLLGYSTGIITKFKLLLYPPGFLLVFPKLYNNKIIIKKEKAPKKLSKVFLETRNWYKEQGVSSISQLNKIIIEGRLSELITISEALHEKKIVEIAETITKRKDKIKIVLIAGPSASGKTTFSKRLAVQLRVNNINPVSISLDNYFLDRDKTPKNKDGSYNFESLEALDLKLLNKHLYNLLEGKKIEMPVYDFYVGKRKEEFIPLKLEPDQIILIEGIHGLNDKLTSAIPREQKYKIYVSALIQLRISDFLRIRTTDIRLLRRIIRDNFFRNHTALQTLRMWKSIRSGEELYIFPFQENADVIFNSALIYEISVLKTYVYKLLSEIPHTSAEYSEASRLIQLLDFFVSAPSKSVPPTSILREFIGGSSFKY